ncbi:MAG TPA: type I restriction enzyme HsdR N-terminal domain-containing protein [Edaphocola sp.]|nr:type I restriction enzyme HsdR N-terminal domain-containing protein [Edaphocola sp.]
MIGLQFPAYDFRFQDRTQGRYIFDIIRKKYVFLTPEEWVRQNLLHYLIDQQGYPKGLISIEKEIKVNGLKKRYDMVVFDRSRRPWMLIECKEAQVSITDDVLRQLLRYHQVLQCPYWMLSNGRQNFCAAVAEGHVEWLSRLPFYNG